MAGELSDGGRLTLWLTQRLLHRLVPALLAWLQQHDVPQAAPDSSQVLYAEALQGFAQQAARARLQPLAAVQVEEDSPACLVEAVDVAKSSKNLRLVFRGDAGAVAAMGLQAQALRQWLGILCDVWCKAGWPSQMWPEWLLEGTYCAPSAEGSALVH